LCSKLGLERSLGTRLVAYADDLVILCRKGNAEAALQAPLPAGLDLGAQSGRLDTPSSDPPVSPPGPQDPARRRRDPLIGQRRGRRFLAQPLH
jgi:hypothetical protein